MWYPLDFYFTGLLHKLTRISVPHFLSRLFFLWFLLPFPTLACKAGPCHLRQCTISFLLDYFRPSQQSLPLHGTTNFLSLSLNLPTSEVAREAPQWPNPPPIPPWLKGFNSQAQTPTFDRLDLAPCTSGPPIWPLHIACAACFMDIINITSLIWFHWGSQWLTQAKLPFNTWLSLQREQRKYCYWKRHHHEGLERIRPNLVTSMLLLPTALVLARRLQHPGNMSSSVDWKVQEMF